MIGGRASQKICRCGCENVHICSVEVEQETEKTTVGSKGTEITPIDRRKDLKRGSEVTIVFACEFGCVTRETWEFHKGVTYFHAVRAEGHPGEILEETLWRD